MDRFVWFRLGEFYNLMAKMMELAHLDKFYIFF